MGPRWTPAQESSAETSDRPEYSRRRSGEALSHFPDVDAVGGVLCRGNMKTGTLAKEMPSQNVASVEKLVKVCDKGVINSILLTHICKKKLLRLYYFLDVLR